MDHLKTKVKEHELDKQEGDELKKLAIQYEIEKKKLDQIRMEEKLQLGKSKYRLMSDLVISYHRGYPYTKNSNQDLTSTFYCRLR